MDVCLVVSGGVLNAIKAYKAAACGQYLEFCMAGVYRRLITVHLKPLSNKDTCLNPLVEHEHASEGSNAQIVWLGDVDVKMNKSYMNGLFAARCAGRPRRRSTHAGSDTGATYVHEGWLLSMGMQYAVTDASKTHTWRRRTTKRSALDHILVNSFHIMRDPGFARA